MIQILQSPWASTFESLLHDTKLSLLISSPFISYKSCKRIIDCKNLSVLKNDIAFELITDFSLNNIVSGVTSIDACRLLMNFFSKLSIRFLPSLHAKVYVFDSRAAVVTSGNLTEGGLVNNFEMGAVFHQADQVKSIKTFTSQYGELGTRIDCGDLDKLASIAKRIKCIENSIQRRKQVNTS